MKRTDLLDENYLLTMYSGLAKDVNELTAQQGMSGISGMLSYVTQTGSAWDYTAALTSPSPTYGYYKTLTVTYTSDRTQQFPIINMFADIYCNGTAASNKPTMTPGGIYRWSDGTNSVVIEQWGVRNQSMLTSATQMQWVCAFDYFGTVTVYFKAYVSGTCGGTLSVVAS